MVVAAPLCQVSAVMAICENRGIPVVFALTRRRLGKALGKKVRRASRKESDGVACRGLCTTLVWYDVACTATAHSQPCIDVCAY